MADNDEKKDPKTSFIDFVELYGWDEEHPYVADIVKRYDLLEEAKQTQRKYEPVRILKKLLDGERIEMNQYTWCLTEEGKLCIVAQNVTLHREELLGTDMSLEGFIDMVREEFDRLNELT